MCVSRAEVSLVHPPGERITFGAAPPPVPTTLTDEELIRRVQGGDAAALTELYDRYAGYVFAIAIRILGDRELAEEVVQDTFLSCWRRADSYQPARGRVASWLIGIARHRAIDSLRSRPSQDRRREAASFSDTDPAEPGGGHWPHRTA
jgi:RNA polymerase sigma-70 factor (ECF subfamily)